MRNVTRIAITARSCTSKYRKKERGERCAGVVPVDRDSPRLIVIIQVQLSSRFWLTLGCLHGTQSAHDRTIERSLNYSKVMMQRDIKSVLACFCSVAVRRGFFGMKVLMVCASYAAELESSIMYLARVIAG